VQAEQAKQSRAVQAKQAKQRRAVQAEKDKQSRFFASRAEEQQRRPSIAECCYTMLYMFCRLVFVCYFLQSCTCLLTMPISCNACLPFATSSYGDGSG
jgi:hypothetical protein